MKVLKDGRSYEIQISDKGIYRIVDETGLEFIVPSTLIFDLIDDYLKPAKSHFCQYSGVNVPTRSHIP